MTSLAYFMGNIRSRAVRMDTGLCVLLPHDRLMEPGERPCRVLYLLHGLGDDCSAWTRYTRLEKHIHGTDLAVVMPQVQRSFYLDMAMGENYFTYVTEELPELCRQMFHISERREDTFVAGLSMGGYGALKCALSHPDRYAACASFSGAVSVKGAIGEFCSEEDKTAFQAGLGVDLSIPDHLDLFELAKEVADLPPAQRPRILITCGQQDYLYSMNQSYKRHLKDLSLDFTYLEWPGEHEWSFWDASIQKAIPFFLGKDRA